MVTLTWRGGEHEFALRIGELRALQEACDAGPQEILNRLIFGTWRVDDIFQTIRLGLMAGSEMDRKEALGLIEKAWEEVGPARLAPVAQAVLGAALVRPEDEDDGEENAPGEMTGPAPGPENGASAASTETAL